MAGLVLPFTQPARKVAWLKRDVLLFAASIGVEAKHGLHFLYELHPRFQPFPTYPIVLTFKLTDTDTIDFLARNAATPLPPSSPPLDWATAVDAKRRLVIYKPLPPSSSGADFELRTRVLGVWDKRKAATLDLEHTLVRVGKEGRGETVYTWAFETAFFVGPKIVRYPPPKRAPDVEERYQTTPQSAHLYRLNGDYNPLHADPSAGRAMGYPGIIMHGLFSWNVAAARILQRFTRANDGAALRDFQARFTAPVRPGDELEVCAWEVGVVEGGECDEAFGGERLREVRFVVRVGGRVVLEDGRALLAVEEGGEEKRVGAKL